MQRGLQKLCSDIILLLNIHVSSCKLFQFRIWQFLVLSEVSINFSTFFDNKDS
jgi:hypothetical protein